MGFTCQALKHLVMEIGASDPSLLFDLASCSWCKLSTYLEP